MRSSSIALVSVLGLAASFVALQGCSLECTGNSCTAKTVPEFVDSSQPAKTSADDWNGTDDITVQNDGVNPLTGNGGVEVNFDPSATKVTAKGIFAGRADTESEAQLSIKDAINGFTVTGNSVKCGHGAAHGTSTVNGSGCKLLSVTVPSGSAAKPLRLRIGSGNGGVRFNGTPTAIKVVVTENGLGDVVVKVTPVKDAEIVVTGEDAVNVAVPADFSSQSVVLTVNSSTSDETAARIITSAFQGMESNKSYPTAGATQNAAKVLNVQSKGLLDSDTVTISKL